MWLAAMLVLEVVSSTCIDRYAQHPKASYMLTDVSALNNLAGRQGDEKSCGSRG